MKKIKLTETHQATNATDQQEQDPDDNQSHFFLLPNHIILEILSRIPVKSLIQCRSVCKSWRRSLSDSLFTKSLLSQTPTCVLLQSSKSIDPNSPSLFLIDLDKASTRNDVVIRLPKDPNVLTRRVQIVGSCNGLLCMYDRVKCAQLYISNPIIGESLSLPALSRGIDYQSLCGFGFCPTSEVYKVVVVTFPSEGTDDHGEVEILTVGSGVWRSVGKFVYHFGYQPYGVYVNGFLHWIVQTSEGAASICAFDMENECFGEMPLPPCSLKRSVVSIGIQKGWLSVFVRRSDISVWMMKDYGVEESWTKELVIKENLSVNVRRLLGQSTRSSSAAQVLKFTKKGQVLLLDKYDLHVYTPGKRGFVPLKVDGVPYMVEAYVHTPSFIKLCDAIRG